MLSLEQRWSTSVSKELIHIIPVSEIHKIICSYAFENFNLIRKQTEDEISLVSATLDTLRLKHEELLYYPNSFYLFKRDPLPGFNENYYDFAVNCFYEYYLPREYSIIINDTSSGIYRSATISISLNNCVLDFKLRTSSSFLQSVLIQNFSYSQSVLIQKLPLLSNKIPTLLSAHFNTENRYFHQINDVNNSFNNLDISKLHWQLVNSQAAKSYFDNYIKRFPHMIDFALVMCVFTSLFSLNF